MSNDHTLVMALHAAISRRSWNEVEHAANRIRDDRRIRWPDDTHTMTVTEDMIRAGRAAHRKHGCGAVGDVFRAMIEANPASPASAPPKMPATRQVFEIVLDALNYDGDDIDSLTVGEIRRALPGPCMKPLEPLLLGESRSEYLDRLEAAENVSQDSPSPKARFDNRRGRFGRG